MPNRNRIYTTLLIISFILLPNLVAAQRVVSEPLADLVLYFGWQEKEKGDSTYLKAYRKFEAGHANRPEENHAKKERGMIAELHRLSAAFTTAFWVEKDYDRAFYISFQLEEILPRISEADYPDKRRVYYKLGEAYYLLLDYHKSIELLEKALSRIPLSFNDTANLDALNILGICYANIGKMDISDTYFRATLLSKDIVRQRPLYNAYAVSHLGCNEMIRGNYDNALALSSTVWPTLRETDDYGHLAGMCYCRGQSYLQKEDYRQASVWIDSLVYFAHKDQYNRTKRIKQAFLLQADYYSALGDAKQTKVYADSLISVYMKSEREYTSQYIAGASQRYGDERIAIQSAQLKMSRTSIFLVSLIAFLCIIGVLIVWSLYRKKNAAYKKLAQKAQEWAAVSLHENEAASPKTDTEANGNGNEVPGEEYLRIMALADREMMENYAYREAGITLDSLAAHLDIRRNVLSGAINKVTGGNFNQYINGYRIRDAVHIISETDHEQLRIEQIYERVGFGNRNSFYRTFKQFTGLSPAEFQKSKDNSIH